MGKYLCEHGISNAFDCEDCAMTKSRKELIDEIQKCGYCTIDGTGKPIYAIAKEHAEFILDLIETSIEAKYAGGWISVEDELPDENEVVIFWLVGKPPEECYHDTSGNPICANSEPYMYECKWRCWSPVMKPSHWQSLPNPPKD